MLLQTCPRGCVTTQISTPSSAAALSSELPPDLRTLHGFKEFIH